MTLEEVYVRVHTSGRCRAHRTASHSLRSFGRTGIVDRMVFDILRQILTAVQTFFQLGMSDVTTHDDSAVQRQAGGNRILSQLFQDIFHRLVQINLHHITLTGFTEFGRNQFTRIAVELFNPDTVLVDFTLDVTVGRAGNAQAYRTRSTVTRQTDNTYIMSQILTSELCTKTNSVSFFQHFFLQLYITECTAEFVTRSRQVVIEMSGSQFHSQQVFLGRCTADNECDMIRRTCSRTQRFDFLNKERHKCTGIQNSFRFLIEISLVGRTAAFGHTKELVLHALGSLDINLCRKVTLRIYLIVHSKRSILRIA